MGKFLFNPTTGDRNAKNSLQPSRDNVFLGIALGATEPHRIGKLIPPVITNTREWLLYMAGTDPETLKGFYDKNDGRDDQQGDKELVLSWRAHRRSEFAGLGVTVYNAKEGDELTVDAENSTAAAVAQYMNALNESGIELENPAVLNVCVYDNGEPYTSTNLSMSIINDNGIGAVYRFNDDLTFDLLETSDEDDDTTIYLDNSVFPVVYVVDRRPQAI